MDAAPTIDEARAAACELAPHVVRTPVLRWPGRAIMERLGAATDVQLKLELFQASGTFKARGALMSLLRLDEAARVRGVTAVSAGNHAIAVAYAAARLGTTAKVVMQSSANPARIAAARAWGAEVILGGDGASSFARAEAIAAEEGRTFIHPFEGKSIALGTATIGLELHEQAGALDAVVVAVGGGGLASGLAPVLRQLQPDCAIFGVEPEGADTMRRSLAAGAAAHFGSTATIADSLAPPMTLPYSFAMCRDNLAEVVTVSDDAMCTAMALLFQEAKLAVEPAGAAATAALLGPLRERLAGKRVGVIVCGANIDSGSFATLIARGEAACISH